MPPPPWYSWISPGPQTSSTKERCDRRGRDFDRHLLQFAADAHVAPPRVLPSDAHYRGGDLHIQPWPPRLAAVPSPFPADELPVPPPSVSGQTRKQDHRS